MTLKREKMKLESKVKKQITKFKIKQKQLGLSTT